MVGRLGAWAALATLVLSAAALAIGFVTLVRIAILSIDWIVLIITGALLLVVFRRVGRPAPSHRTG